MATFPDLAILLSRLRDNLNEATAAQWTDAELKRLLAYSEYEIANKTNCIESIVTEVTVPNNRFITVAASKVLYIEHIPSSGVPVGLIRITPKMLGHVKLNLENNLPRYWFKWGNQIIIEPQPDAAYTLNIFKASYPTYQMYDDTDEPQIPSAYYNQIFGNALWMAKIKNGKYGSAGQMYTLNMLELATIQSANYKRRPDYNWELKSPNIVQMVRPGEESQRPTGEE